MHTYAANWESNISVFTSSCNYILQVIRFMHLLRHLYPVYCSGGIEISWNRLRLNPTKTPCIWLGTRKARSCMGEVAIPLLKSTTPLLQPEGASRQRVTNGGSRDHLCRSCFNQLCQIRIIRLNLSFRAAVTLPYAFIILCLQNCTSILFWPLKSSNCAISRPSYTVPSESQLPIRHGI